MILYKAFAHFPISTLLLDNGEANCKFKSSWHAPIHQRSQKEMACAHCDIFLVHDKGYWHLTVVKKTITQHVLCTVLSR